TVNHDGTPYVTPIHFVYKDNTVYFHGLPDGQKIKNIKANKNVSIAVYNMDGLIMASVPDPCNVNTKYQSVIITGEAQVLEAMTEKETALKYLVEKHVPELAGMDMSEAQIRGTAVVAVHCTVISGKYYG
ncbi:MAG: pyridoxamine 5'-phosphate oxidase family protein, partial [Bacillota bacterium]